ncbi:hypothetical protein Nepgr_015843 [Nepenthes gracilis]|uniref:Uncharacterized protein n=1 Tax=Nepenthes gracilis TaxID=150966 RepID=A0AAD3SMR5_NEPGR|nr:hypothetical protein Nepgr_015843 [Nepenthes gracilis]
MSRGLRGWFIGVARCLAGWYVGTWLLDLLKMNLLDPVQSLAGESPLASSPMVIARIVRIAPVVASLRLHRFCLFHVFPISCLFLLGCTFLPKGCCSRCLLVAGMLE